MEPTYLDEHFTAEYGVGPKQAARIERFQRASGLLRGTAPVAEVAARCGFADQAHLARDFRDLGGCSPTQWRQASRTFVQDSGVGA